jgi:hypothetical protein
MPRRGEVRVRDLRDIHGAALDRLQSVHVLVLDVGGGMPVAAIVQLADLVGGPRVARAFACPACGRPVLMLLARRGLLRCRGCHRARTRRQNEHHLADFRRRGGLEEDMMLRLLPPVRPFTRARLEQAGALAELLLSADRARVRALRDQVTVLSSRPEVQR